jgi:hypothetical protein
VGRQPAGPADAKVVDQRPAVEQERVYPMGPLRKISGRLRVEDKVESRGQVSSVTYELPVERSAREAFTSARETLQRTAATRCSGARAAIAARQPVGQRVFANARLNGGDEQQAFILLRRSAEADTLVAVQRTRGNRRAYLHVKNSSPAARWAKTPTAATVLREMRDTGKLDYPDLAEPRDSWVTLLARSLNLDSTLRASLSGAQAEAWREQLVKAGVRDGRPEVGTAPTDGLHLELIR